jgi:hypothetical protein
MASCPNHGRSTNWRTRKPMLAEAGFEIVSADFDRRLYGAYTCVKAR